MAKVQRTEQFFDEELKANGKRRISVPETVIINDQYLATVYRERVVKASDYDIEKTKKPWWKTKKSSKSKS